MYTKLQVPTLIITKDIQTFMGPIFFGTPCISFFRVFMDAEHIESIIFVIWHQHQDQIPIFFNKYYKTGTKAAMPVPTHRLFN